MAAALLTATVWAQAPEKMSYQAVIRNSSDVLVTNTQIGMQISILQGSESGAAVYVETQTPTTNANGLVSIEIGGGTVLSGDLTAIDWSNEPYFIKTEIDPAGSTSYSITGTSQLLSVPYALHANTAETVTGGIDYNDLTNAPDLSIYATKSNSISLNIYGAYITGDATFNTGFGRYANMSLPKSGSPSPTFTMNFIVPHDYTPGTTLNIKIIASAASTGVVYLRPNAVSIATETNFLQGTIVTTGLSVGTIDITTADTPHVFWGTIVSPVAEDLTPGTAITFNIYRNHTHSNDTNASALRIHGIQITY